MHCKSSSYLRVTDRTLTLSSSRLPPRQLPLLAVYAYSVLYACNRGWISRETAGKGGAAVVGVLSMGKRDVNV